MCVGLNLISRRRSLKQAAFFFLILLQLRQAATLSTDSKALIGIG
jgi:hypothetical protein